MFMLQWDLTRFYILNAAKEPVATDFVTWKKWFHADENVYVARTGLTRDIIVSTAFLGVPRTDDGKDYLFETMVLGSAVRNSTAKLDVTWSDAWRTHLDMVAAVKRKIDRQRGKPR
jgi:hypothetical protein